MLRNSASRPPDWFHPPPLSGHSPGSWQKEAWTFSTTDLWNACWAKLQRNQRRCQRHHSFVWNRLTNGSSESVSHLTTPPLVFQAVEVIDRALRVIKPVKLFSSVQTTAYTSLLEQPVWWTAGEPIRSKIVMMGCFEWWQFIFRWAVSYCSCEHNVLSATLTHCGFKNVLLQPSEIGQMSIFHTSWQIQTMHLYYLKHFKVVVNTHLQINQFNGINNSLL